jgi:hypothetical protein
MHTQNKTKQNEKKTIKGTRFTKGKKEREKNPLQDILRSLKGDLANTTS